MVILPWLFGTLHSDERQRQKSGFLAFAAGRLLGFASLRGFFGFLEISGSWRTLITRLAHFFAAAVGNAFMLGLDIGVKTGVFLLVAIVLPIGCGEVQNTTLQDCKR